jgi:hypothetical protein
MDICWLAAVAALDVAIAASTARMMATNIITFEPLYPSQHQQYSMCIAKPIQHEVLLALRACMVWPH